MIGRFDGYDELYWNVTGNGWDFPIDQASATITLPSPARFGQRAAYTGSQGSTEQAARVTDEDAGHDPLRDHPPALCPRRADASPSPSPRAWSTTRPQSTRLGWFLSDWAPPLAGAAGLAGMLGYLFYAWRAPAATRGRARSSRSFRRPTTCRPAAMRYIVEQKLDNRAFAAALVDAAVKGHVRLVEEDGGFFRQHRTADRAARPRRRTAARRDRAGGRSTRLVGPGEIAGHGAEKPRRHSRPRRRR